MNDWFMIELAKIRSNEIQRELAMIRLAKSAASNPSASSMQSIRSIKSILSIAQAPWNRLLALTGKLFLNLGDSLLKRSGQSRRPECC